MWPGQPKFTHESGTQRRVDPARRSHASPPAWIQRAGDSRGEDPMRGTLQAEPGSIVGKRVDFLAVAPDGRASATGGADGAVSRGHDGRLVVPTAGHAALSRAWPGFLTVGCWHPPVSIMAPRRIVLVTLERSHRYGPPLTYRVRSALLAVAFIRARSVAATSCQGFIVFSMRIPVRKSQPTPARPGHRQPAAQLQPGVQL